jgi:hypothetical protein
VAQHPSAAGKCRYRKLRCDQGSSGQFQGGRPHGNWTAASGIASDEPPEVPARVVIDPFPRGRNADGSEPHPISLRVPSALNTPRRSLRLTPAEFCRRFATAYRFLFENTIWLATFVTVTSAISTSDAVQAI